MKVSSSNRVNDLQIHNTLQVTLNNNLLTFRDTRKALELKGDLLKMMTNKNSNVDLANLSDKKVMFDFAQEVHFDNKGSGNKSIRDRTRIKSPKPPALVIYSSGISNTFFYHLMLTNFANG